MNHTERQRSPDPIGIERVMEDTKKILPKMGWRTKARPTKTPNKEFYGYNIKKTPPGVRHLWLGVVNNQHWNGIYVGATPASNEGTKTLMKEGYKLSPTGKPQWFLKRLISEKNIRRWQKAKGREKTKILKCLVENTYPF